VTSIPLELTCRERSPLGNYKIIWQVGEIRDFQIKKYLIFMTAGVQEIDT
jgi:hypothetical protein